VTKHNAQNTHKSPKQKANKCARQKYALEKANTTYNKNIGECAENAEIQSGQCSHSKKQRIYKF